MSSILSPLPLSLVSDLCLFNVVSNKSCKWIPMPQTLCYSRESLKSRKSAYYQINQSSLNQRSVDSQNIETLSPRYHTIETVSVPQTRKYNKHPNQSMSNNLIDFQQMKNVYNTEKQMIKLDLLNIRSLSTKALFLNDMIIN